MNLIQGNFPMAPGVTAIHEASRQVQTAYDRFESTLRDVNVTLKEEDLTAVYKELELSEERIKKIREKLNELINPESNPVQED